MTSKTAQNLQPPCPPIEELWERYQREYDRQKKLRELATKSTFKRRVDLQLKLLNELRENWGKFSNDEKLLFSEYFSDPYRVARIYDLESSRLGRTNLDFSIFNEEFPVNEPKVGRPPAYANIAICRFLLEGYLQASGENPNKYDGQPCIKFVERALVALRDYVQNLENSPAKREILDFKSVPHMCLKILEDIDG